MKTNTNSNILIDEFNIKNSGTLIQDMRNLDIRVQEEKVPEIETREVIIKETGNFLNLKDKIINIPIEMIVFPFFTPQKQNKRINFKYSFEDLGVTMKCMLTAFDEEDKVFQPSIFEEKIYTFLISMYEEQQSVENEYIKFEISDFIVNFLGNKMNRNYYSKVEQALKNLKNTQYEFEISNHTKFGRYKFEDEEFKLLTYKKLKIGKKVFYQVKLNKNIRNKIRDKRYIKYNSKSLLEIMSKDPIASRIYKYISQQRYHVKTKSMREEDTMNIKTLAAIVPLKTEQVTERKNKNGEVKRYYLSRIKQVLKRIEKAYDVLVSLNYLLEYNVEFLPEEDTYFITYKFNPEKDGECHIFHSFIENKTEKSKRGLPKASNVEDAEIVTEELKSKNVKSRVAKKQTVPDTLVDFPLKIREKIKIVKENIIIQKNWNKRVDNKIKSLYKSNGEDFAIYILNVLENVAVRDPKKTLVNHMKSIEKNYLKEQRENINQGQLFKPVARPAKPSREDLLQKKKEIKSVSFDGVMDQYNGLDDLLKVRTEERAIELFVKTHQEMNKAALISMKKLIPAPQFYKMIHKELKLAIDDISS